MVLNGCSSTKVDTYKDNAPPFALDQYFDGPIKGWGIVQDFSGKMVRSFHVDMMGSWQGNIGTLKEHFLYNDGETQDRTWTITKMPDGTFEGTADDILDKALGQSSGNATQWKYRMDLKIKDSTYRITFDDWMFRMDGNVIINRSYLKKFGITVAELTIFMQKQK